MKTKWFRKTTDPIPLINPRNHTYKSGGLIFTPNFVQGVINLFSGNVYINYNYESWWNPLFWYKHFHEFLHRIFWYFKCEKLEKIIDVIDSTCFRPDSLKRFRKNQK